MDLEFVGNGFEVNLYRNNSDATMLGDVCRQSSHRRIVKECRQYNRERQR